VLWPFSLPYLLEISFHFSLQEFKADYKEIVVYVPEGVEVRYRIWTAGAELKAIEKG